MACSARVGDEQRPALTFPGESARETAPRPRARPTPPADAGVATNQDTEALRSDLPDPQPLSSARQWRYRFRFERGQVSVESVEERRFERPVVTPRKIGRFAVELWIGRELIDRVRFDFPMLAAEEPPNPERRMLHEPPKFGPGAQVVHEVLVPHSERATRALLVDRATGRVVALRWPPDRPAPLPNPANLPQDAGAAAVPSNKPSHGS